MAIETAQLLDMSQEQLDELFRSSEAGPIPSGEGAGTVIVAPGTELSEIAAKVIHLLVWQGKIFDPERGELRNRILPIGLPAVSAKVYREASWFDGKECIVLDYSQTSLIAQRIRDEIRQIAPNTYLGIVYWGHAKLLNFALSFPAPA